MKAHDQAKITLRHLHIEDYLGLQQSMSEAYATMGGTVWEKSEIEKLLNIFPEGQLCLLVDNKVVASALSLIVDYDTFIEDHSYEEVTGNSTFTTHDSNGDVLYGIELFVHPDYRSMRLGRRLYDVRKELCEKLNLRGILVGGRLPNYHHYSDQLTPKDYIQKVRLQEIHDPTLTFQLSNDFHVKKVMKNYLPEDQESEEFATLLEWANIYFESRPRLVNAERSVIRLGLVQWQMRSFPDLDALCEQIEFFVDAISDYQSDFCLFPEFFNAPLMAKYNKLSEAEAIRRLADYTEPLREKFREFALSYNVNIITGSMPMVRNEQLYNVGFLCKRDGAVETYEKIHMTPSEVSSWGMQGGSNIKTYHTDCGKIGIMICYDVEFPELSRLLADEGMQILFVPFLTDTQNGYMRIRRCAQARAIENECYVAIAGCVGNLPRVNNMDIQFGQSAVFTPSDFAFPTNGIKAEATPNTEMTLIVDIDMNLLKELHNFGSVKNLKDRRFDLYQLSRR